LIQVFVEVLRRVSQNLEVELAQLSPDQLDRIFAERQDARAHSYRRYGMTCGLLCFLTCIGSFTYLVMQGHDAPAYTILGATVVGIIGQMIRAKL
jgi:hypothetical protein